jgi:hypothetical protein
MAGTLDSYSTCPCKAKFIPSMMDDTYEKSSGASTAESAAGFVAPGQTSQNCPPISLVSKRQRDLYLITLC